MPIVDLNSLRGDNNEDDDSADDENNRYVGGVGARGGGSGLAVVPNQDQEGAPPSDAIFNLAEAADPPPSGNDGAGGEVRRTITMYRSGFTVDDGPHRRLDDPANAEFLRNLARGMVPSELRREVEGQGEVLVGLVDKRGQEYDPSKHVSRGRGDGPGGVFESFSGEGQALSSGDGALAAAAAGGIIDPVAARPPAPLDESRPSTSVAVRLPSGKRIVVRVNLDAPVSEVGNHIGQQAGAEPYVLTGGYPPAAIGDLMKTVEEAGLKGAQVAVRKA